MVLPTEEQRVQILVHHAWDLRDDGLDDKSVIKQLIDEGVPSHIARSVPDLISQALPGLIHSDEQRERLVNKVESAVEAEEYDEIRAAMLEGIDDRRTLCKIYNRLAELLLSDSEETGTAAAYGLSFMVGWGDWPLIQALSHDNWEVRFRAAFALGKMGKAAHNARESLKEATSDTDDYVREAALKALEEIERDLKPWWKFW